jgi:hypothetical protein
MGNDIPERVAIVEQIAASAHKRIDSNDIEIKGLRDSRHGHANMLQRHDGLIAQHTDILKSQNETLKTMSDVVVSIKAMVVMAIFLGTIFLTFCGFVGNEIFKWW